MFFLSSHFNSNCFKHALLATIRLTYWFSICDVRELWYLCKATPSQAGKKQKKNKTHMFHVVLLKIFSKKARQTKLIN